MDSFHLAIYNLSLILLLEDLIKEDYRNPVGNMEEKSGGGTESCLRETIDWFQILIYRMFIQVCDKF